MADRPLVHIFFFVTWTAVQFARSPHTEAPLTSSVPQSSSSACAAGDGTSFKPFRGRPRWRLQKARGSTAAWATTKSTAPAPTSCPSGRPWGAPSLATTRPQPSGRRPAPPVAGLPTTLALPPPARGPSAATDTSCGPTHRSGPFSLFPRLAHGAFKELVPFGPK